MKYIVFTFILFSFFGTAYGAKMYLQGTKVAEIKAIGLTETGVYRFDDTNGVSCYFGYIMGNKNTPPVMDCVKVND